MPQRTVEVYRRMLHAIEETNADGYADVFAPDGVLELPFTRPGVPPRRQGREEIRAAAKQGWAAVPLRFEQVRDVRVHETTDPELIIAEHELTGVGTDNGRPFAFPVVVLLRVRDGQAVLFREYLNVLAVAEATDRLPDLAASLDTPGRPTSTDDWPGTAGPPPEPPARSTRPRDVYARYQHQILAHSAAGVADLFAPDGLLEFPFTVPGLPPRRYEGRDQIRSGLSGLLGRRVRFEEYRNVRIHECVDPEVIVVEHDIAGTLIATGRPHLMSYIYVVRVRDGEIVHIRATRTRWPCSRPWAGGPRWSPGSGLPLAVEHSGRHGAADERAVRPPPDVSSPSLD